MIKIKKDGFVCVSESPNSYWNLLKDLIFVSLAQIPTLSSRMWLLAGDMRDKTNGVGRNRLILAAESSLPAISKLGATACCGWQVLGIHFPHQREV